MHPVIHKNPSIRDHNTLTRKLTPLMLRCLSLATAAASATGGEMVSSRSLFGRPRINHPFRLE